MIGALPPAAPHIDADSSTSIALLAIAGAWVRQPSKRSALFVFHTRITKWMYLTGWIAANAPKRPALHSGFVVR